MIERVKQLNLSLRHEKTGKYQSCMQRAVYEVVCVCACVLVLAPQ